MPLYYTIEKKEDSQSAEWEPLTDHKIDPEEASYLSEYLDISGANLENSLGKLVKWIRNFTIYESPLNPCDIWLRRDDPDILINVSLLPPPLYILLFAVKNMGTAKAYVFRVYAHSATAYTPSDPFRWERSPWEPAVQWSTVPRLSPLFARFSEFGVLHQKIMVIGII